MTASPLGLSLGQDPAAIPGVIVPEERRLYEIVFPLRHDQDVLVTLPPDLTLVEADRLATLIRAWAQVALRPAATEGEGT